MKTLKRVAKWLSYLIGALILLAMMQFAYGYFREPIAKQHAMDFCAAVKVGEPADGLEEKARDDGSGITKWSVLADGQRVLMATFIGIPPFSRHICLIKADAKVVLEVKYTYMD